MRWKRFWEKINNWELWPFKLRYLGISPVWLWYCLKARSFWFFTPSNPTLTFGGFEGESKKEMYRQLPPHLYPKTIYIAPGTPFTIVKSCLQENDLTYPFVVKPDVGMSGILVRRINSEAQLEQYHRQMPVEYIIQAITEYPIEYSVFYYRYPNSNKGVITGFLQKTPLYVTGDGESNLLELILLHPKAKHRLVEMQQKHQSSLYEVLPKGDTYYLSYAANLNRGASFINLHQEIDERLHRVFDELNLYSKTFYYGRYDLKANSVEELKQGKNFSILEFNGSGAEPNHVYNSGYTLRQAHKEIVRHWKVLYEIAKCNHNNGITYWPFLKGWRFLKAAKQHFKNLKKIDV